MRALAIGSLLVLPALVGCVATDDAADPTTGPGSPGVPAPSWAIEIPDVIGGLGHVAWPLLDDGAQGVPSGAGIWADGDHAYVSGLGSGFHVVRVSDPTAPVVVGSITDEFFSRDADVVHGVTAADGSPRVIVALATQGSGMTLVDATDPSSPRVVRVLEDVAPNHNLAVVPGTCLVYNSPSNGQGNPNQIVDACEPEDAQVVGEFGDHGCHDITFWSSPDGSSKRAYCAGVSQTQIYDIADPLEPELVARINDPFVDNGGGLHHSAFVDPDGDILIIGDEFMGGGGPGCWSGAGPAQSPIGALHFYDITDEAAPVRLGHFSPPPPASNMVPSPGDIEPTDPFGTVFGGLGVSCTSHFGDFVPGHEMVVWGWYTAGVLLIDYADPAAPTLVSQWADGTNTWDAKVHNGYVFTGDIRRGLDVLRFVPA